MLEKIDILRDIFHGKYCKQKPFPIGQLQDCEKNILKRQQEKNGYKINWQKRRNNDGSLPDCVTQAGIPVHGTRQNKTPLKFERRFNLFQTIFRTSIYIYFQFSFTLKLFQNFLIKNNFQWRNKR